MTIVLLFYSFCKFSFGTMLDKLTACLKFQNFSWLRNSLLKQLCQNLMYHIFLSRKSVSLPLKWFTIGQCWRYERMTRGRRREHYQWNMDIFGVSRVRVRSVPAYIHCLCNQVLSCYNLLLLLCELVGGAGY